MNRNNFGVDDIVSYLNQELPGFEPSIVSDERTEATLLRVKTAIKFGSYGHIYEPAIEIPLPGYQLLERVDALVRETRQGVIKSLGLQKEIDAEVKRRVDRERRDIEEKAYKKAMDDALQQIARSAGLTPAIESIQFFLNGGKP